jgi:hypothetical protein
MSKRVKGQNCGNRSINIDKIEDFVWRVLFLDNKLYDVIKQGLTDSKNTKSILIQLNDERSLLKSAIIKKDNILNMVADGLLTADEVKEKMQEIRNEIEKRNQTIYELESYLKKIDNQNPDEVKNENIFQNMTFDARKKLIEKYIKSIKILWIEDILEEEIVKYYIITVENSVNKNLAIFTNGYGLNLDEWYKIDFDIKTGLYFSYSFVPKEAYIKNLIKEGPFYIHNNEGYPDYTTLAPSGNSDYWTYEDYCEYYGEARYKKYRAEFKHKLSSSLIQDFFPHH